jgi:hypothetical protein
LVQKEIKGLPDAGVSRERRDRRVLSEYQESLATMEILGV